MKGEPRTSRSPALRLEGRFVEARAVLEVLEADLRAAAREIRREAPGLANEHDDAPAWIFVERASYDVGDALTELAAARRHWADAELRWGDAELRWGVGKG